MDKIRLLQISLFGYHGCSAEEQAVGQPYEVDVEMALDLRAAGESDDLTATVDYSTVVKLVSDINAAAPYHLLEAFAERIAKDAIRRYPIREIIVRVRKPHPPVGMVVGAAEVEIIRRVE